MEDNILMQEIEKILNAKIEDWAQSFTEGLTPAKQLYSLTFDVVFAFYKWRKKSGSRDLARYFKTLYPVSEKQEFEFFIQHIYNKE